MLFKYLFTFPIFCCQQSSLQLRIHQLESVLGNMIKVMRRLVRTDAHPSFTTPYISHAQPTKAVPSRERHFEDHSRMMPSRTYAVGKRKRHQHADDLQIHGAESERNINGEIIHSEMPNERTTHPTHSVATVHRIQRTRCNQPGNSNNMAEHQSEALKAKSNTGSQTVAEESSRNCVQHSSNEEEISLENIQDDSVFQDDEVGFNCADDTDMQDAANGRHMAAQAEPCDSGRVAEPLTEEQLDAGNASGWEESGGDGRNSSVEMGRVSASESGRQQAAEDIEGGNLSVPDHPVIVHIKTEVVNENSYSSADEQMFRRTPLNGETERSHNETDTGISSTSSNAMTNAANPNCNNRSEAHPTSKSNGMLDPSRTNIETEQPTESMRTLQEVFTSVTGSNVEELFVEDDEPIQVDASPVKVEDIVSSPRAEPTSLAGHTSHVAKATDYVRFKLNKTGQEQPPNARVLSAVHSPIPDVSFRQISRISSHGGHPQPNNVQGAKSISDAFRSHANFMGEPVDVRDALHQQPHPSGVPSERYHPKNAQRIYNRVTPLPEPFHIPGSVPSRGNTVELSYGSSQPQVLAQTRGRGLKDCPSAIQNHHTSLGHVTVSKRRTAIMNLGNIESSNIQLRSVPNADCSNIVNYDLPQAKKAPQHQRNTNNTWSSSHTNNSPQRQQTYQSHQPQPTIVLDDDDDDVVPVQQSVSNGTLGGTPSGTPSGTSSGQLGENGSYMYADSEYFYVFALIDVDILEMHFLCGYFITMDPCYKEPRYKKTLLQQGNFVPITRNLI